MDKRIRYFIFRKVFVESHEQQKKISGMLLHEHLLRALMSLVSLSHVILNSMINPTLGTTSARNSMIMRPIVFPPVEKAHHR